MSLTTNSSPASRAERADTIASTAPTTRTPRRDWRSMALVAGGLLFAIGNLLHPLQHSDDAYEAATWHAAHLTIFFSLPLLVLGMPALHRCLGAHVGRGLASYSVLASVVGLIGIGPGTIIEAFVAPTIGHEAMEHLESGGMGVINAIFGFAFLSGTIALGWAAHRARLRPRWSGPTIVGGAVALVAVMEATSATAGVVVITATALYGLALAALAPRASAVDLGSALVVGRRITRGWQRPPA